MKLLRLRLLHKAVGFCYRRGVGFPSRAGAGSHAGHRKKSRAG